MSTTQPDFDGRAPRPRPGPIDAAARGDSFISPDGVLRPATSADLYPALPCSSCGRDRIWTNQPLRLCWSISGGSKRVTWRHWRCPGLREIAGHWWAGKRAQATERLGRHRDTSSGTVVLQLWPLPARWWNRGPR